MDYNSIQGVIFDMDGVLVDSERLYLRFWREACSLYGFTLSEEQGLSLRSNSPETAIPKFRAWFGDGADYAAIRDTRRQLMAKYIDKNGVALKEGAAEVINRLQQNGVKLALATASPVKRARYYLEPHGIFGQFDAVVSGTSVAHSKPAPDIYLKAAAALGLAPPNCMAVEDSPTGIVSAHAAGCFTVMIPDLTLPDEETHRLTNCVVERLIDIISLIQ